MLSSFINLAIKMHSIVIDTAWNLAEGEDKNQKHTEQRDLLMLNVAKKLKKEKNVFRICQHGAHWIPKQRFLGEGW
jgi:hypothetical protein